MKHWMDRLNLREKIIIGIGSLVVVFILIYSVVIGPLNNQIQNDREQLQQNQQTLFMMQRLSQEINSYPPLTSVANSQMLSLEAIQTILTQVGLSQGAVNLAQKNNNIILTFHGANFDKLVSALVMIHHQYGLDIQDGTFKKQEPGIVIGAVEFFK